MTGYKVENLSGDYADLIFKQGDTIRLPFLFSEATTGYDAKLCIKNQKDGTEISTFTVANSRVIIGGVNKLITFLMSATDSAELPAPFKGVYQIKITKPDTDEYTLLAGKLTIDEAVCP